MGVRLVGSEMWIRDRNKAEYVKKGGKLDYITMKKFEKTDFFYRGKCEPVMQIDVFTNMGNFTHTLY